MMTALQLNAEIYRSLGVIAEDETLMTRAAKDLKKLAAKKEDPTLMTKEEFFKRVDEAREEIRQGKGRRFSNPEEMNAWLNSL
jgi:DNA-directed RNA polymerase subunit K/omega